MPSVSWLAIILLCMACMDEASDGNGNYSSSLLAIGTVHIIEGHDYYFELDDGSLLYPSDISLVADYEPREGQRAFISFAGLPQSKEGYDYNAVLMHVEDILTKDIYCMPAEKEDSIGHDRINMTHQWIAGGCLNLQYQLLHGTDNTQKHMLNLVVNQAAADNVDDGILTLELRHNAFEDEQTVLSNGIVSFRLDAVAPLLDGVDAIDVRFHSLYDGWRNVRISLK